MGKPWCVYFNQQLQNGSVIDILKEKWSNVPLVSALLLSISLPFVLSPPGLADDSQLSWNSDSVTAIQNIFGSLMAIASICLFIAIFFVFQIYDAFRIHVVTDDDLIEFFLMQGGDVDVPQQLMFAGIYFFFTAILVGLWLVYDVVTSSVISVFGCAFLITIVIKSQKIISDTSSRAQSRFL